MDARTLEALEKSIAHHEACLKADRWSEIHLGGENCALCKTFPYADCDGCPVKDETGVSDCEGTPFYEALRALSNWRGARGTRDEFRAAEQREVDFLKSLRPAKADHGEVAASFASLIVLATGWLVLWSVTPT